MAPAGWRSGVEAVLVVALSARIEDSAAGQDVDRRAAVRFLQEADDDRGRRFPPADPAPALGGLLLPGGVAEPVAAPVEHARVPLWLPRDCNRRAGAGEDDPVDRDHLARLDHYAPLVLVDLNADDLAGDDVRLG